MLRDNGFEIVDLIEIQAPEGAETQLRYDYVSAGLGEEVALRGDLAGAEARMSGRPASTHSRNEAVTHPSHIHDYAHLGGRARQRPGGIRSWGSDAR